MKRSLMLPVAFLLASAATAFADKGDIRFGLQFGPTFPTRAMADYASRGFETGVVVNYMERANQGLGLELSFHDMGERDALAGTWLGSSSLDARTSLQSIHATFHLVVDGPLEQRVSPYLQTGYALTWTRATPHLLGAPYSGAWELSPGFVAGTGVRVRVAPPVSLSLGANYYFLHHGPKWNGVLSPSVTIMRVVGAHGEAK